MADQSSLTFNTPLGTNPANQTIQLTSSGANVPFQMTVSPASVWLQVFRSSTTTPATITVVINAVNQPAGTQSATLTFSSTTAGVVSTSVSITLNVGGSGGGTVGTLVPSANPLSFSSSFGFAPDAQTITISSSTSTTFSVFAAITTGTFTWLSVDPPTTGISVGPGAAANLIVRVNPGSMVGGTYTGTLTLTPASGTATTINVTFFYGSSTGVLTASPNPLVLSAPPGGSTAGNLTVTAPSGNSVNFSVSVSATFGGVTWLQSNTAFGTATSFGTTLSFTASAALLSAGAYSGTITLTATNTSAQTQISVIFNVGTTGTGVLGISPSSLAFNAASGSGAQSQNLNIPSSVGAFIASTLVTTPVGGSWLTVLPTSGTAPAFVTVTANSFGLGAGVYSGLVRVIASGGFQDIPVTLTVGGTGTATNLTVVPAAVAFTGTVGSGLTSTQTVQVTSAGNSVQFAATPSIITPSGGNWLTVINSTGLTNGSFQLLANASGLSAGTYDATVTVFAGGQSVSIPVRFVVGNSASSVSASPGSLNLTAASTGAVVSGTVSLFSLTGASTAFTISFSTGWLSGSASQGTLPAALSITASSSGLGAGTYGGFLMVTPQDGSTPLAIPVTFTVGTTVGGSTSNSFLGVSPSSLTFTAEGGRAPSGQTLTVTSLTGASVNYTVAASTTSGANWLRADIQTQASLTGFAVVSVDPTGLGTGTYQGTVSISVKGAPDTTPVTIPVTLNITSAVRLSASPASLSFTASAGGSPPAAQTISLTATGGATAVSFTATASSSGNWLSVTPASGTTSATLSVSVNPAGLQPGNYNGTITVTSPGSSASTTISVSLAVTVAAATLNVVSGGGQTAVTGQAFSQPLVVSVLNAQGQPVAGASVTFQVSGGSASLSSTSATTNSQGQASVSVTAGASAGQITVIATVPGAGGTLSQNFQLTSRLPGPSFTAAGVVNTFSNEVGVAPLSLATIFVTGVASNLRGTLVANLVEGPLPFALGDVQSVTFGNAPAPIFAVANQNGQESVIIQVPGELSAPSTVSVTIRTAGGGSTTVDGIQIRQFSPGLLETTDAQGRKFAVVLKADGSFVTPDNPARLGERLRMLVTGLGPVTPVTATGRTGAGGQTVIANVVVGLNDAGVQVISAEYAANLVGVYVVTFQVPTDTQTGTNRNLAIAVGDPLVFGNGSVLVSLVP